VRIARQPQAGRGRHKMSTVGRLTGFSPALLRARETRHHLLSPERSSGNQRFYTMGAERDPPCNSKVRST
jgi:hypothetical protein